MSSDISARAKRRPRQQCYMRWIPQALQDVFMGKTARTKVLGDISQAEAEALPALDEADDPSSTGRASSVLGLPWDTEASATPVSSVGTEWAPSES